MKSGKHDEEASAETYDNVYDGGPEIEDTGIHDGGGGTSVQSGDEVEASVKDYGISRSHGGSLQGSVEDAPVMSSHEETV